MPEHACAACGVLRLALHDAAAQVCAADVAAQQQRAQAAMSESGCAGLFSATQTEAVQALARAGLRNPVRVKVDVSASLVR